MVITKVNLKSACTHLGVSRSGYYAWMKRIPQIQAKLVDLKSRYWTHRACCGAPPLGLRSKISRKFKYASDSKHSLPAAPNLLNRQFTVLKPNMIWTTDITYIRTQQGWLYLCVMLDLFSRRVVGWQTSHRIDRQLVCDTFNYAMARQGYPKGVLVHSDQGSQYCSRDFRTVLLTNDAIQSMSRRGNCWDNAVTESFFHTLKGHIIHGSVYLTRKEVR